AEPGGVCLALLERPLRDGMNTMGGSGELGYYGPHPAFQGVRNAKRRPMCFRFPSLFFLLVGTGAHTYPYTQRAGRRDRRGHGNAASIRLRESGAQTLR
ncbi:MAG: hypothetical protein WAM39_32690, partial [Bryobacteraceae bacterium]